MDINESENHTRSWIRPYKQITGTALLLIHGGTVPLVPAASSVCRSGTEHARHRRSGGEA